MKKRKIEYTVRFKRDLKKFRHMPEKRAKITKAIQILAEGHQIRLYMRPHKSVTMPDTWSFTSKAIFF